MPTLSPPLPVRRSDLVIRPSEEKGQHVVKNPLTGEYFNLGVQESFLLARLDGRHTAQSICAEFQKRYGEPLTPDDLEGFLELARGSNLVHETPTRTEHKPQGAPPIKTTTKPAAPPSRPAPTSAPEPEKKPAKARQSILYWRKSFFDPDNLFNWLEPKIRLVWTRGFLVVSALAVVAAGAIVWANRHELVDRFSNSWGWQTLFLAWFALALTTTLHEFAHGLTCKHYGGEVHEVGFLLMYFTPCFYCNVSDAWLLREKSKRLWVTFAGGYCDVVMWALAAFVWRLTAQDTAINYLAWVVLTICAARIFFNFNPLLKLDGYYILSDWTGIPNLRQRGLERWTASLRWLLWGAPRPGADSRGRFLLGFGLAAWLYALVLMGWMLFALMRWANARWGTPGLICTGALTLVVMRGLLQGVAAGEIGRMVLTRRTRAAVWLLLLAAFGSAMCFVAVAEQAWGGFVVRPAARSEIHAPAAGFLREIAREEGRRVAKGDVIARIDIPDLSSRIAQSRAEALELEKTIAFAREEVEHSKYAANSASPADLRDAKKTARAFEAQLEQSAVRLTKVKEELAYLERLAERTIIRSPIDGTVVTPRLKEKDGHYLREGEPVCVIEAADTLEAEVRLSEQEVARVQPGQPVEFKARALPFDNFKGIVLGRSALATPGDVQGTVTVYCRIESPPAALGSGMSGFARIHCGEHSAGAAAAKKVLRFLRTEFWW